MDTRKIVKSGLLCAIEIVGIHGCIEASFASERMQRLQNVAPVVAQIIARVQGEGAAAEAMSQMSQLGQNLSAAEENVSRTAQQHLARELVAASDAATANLVDATTAEVGNAIQRLESGGLPPDQLGAAVAAAVDGRAEESLQSLRQRYEGIITGCLNFHRERVAEIDREFAAAEARLAGQCEQALNQLREQYDWRNDISGTIQDIKPEIIRNFLMGDESMRAFPDAGTRESLGRFMNEVIASHPGLLRADEAAAEQWGMIRNGLLDNNGADMVDLVQNAMFEVLGRLCLAINTANETFNEWERILVAEFSQQIEEADHNAELAEAADVAWLREVMEGAMQEIIEQSRPYFEGMENCFAETQNFLNAFIEYLRSYEEYANIINACNNAYTACEAAMDRGDPNEVNAAANQFGGTAEEAVGRGQNLMERLGQMRSWCAGVLTRMHEATPPVVRTIALNVALSYLTGRALYPLVRFAMERSYAARGPLNHGAATMLGLTPLWSCVHALASMAASRGAYWGITRIPAMLGAWWHSDQQLEQTAEQTRTNVSEIEANINQAVGQVRERVNQLNRL